MWLPPKTISSALTSTLICIATALPANAQRPSQNPFADLSKPESKPASRPAAVAYLFPEQVSIAADKPSPVEFHFKVAEGLHINSHQPHTEDLIPTTLKLSDESGVHLLSARFPSGVDFSFAVNPSEKLNVYTGDFTVHTELTAAKGEHLVQATLRYQACNSESCMPPHSIPVVIDVIAR